ncbi:MAG TPA: folate-binding protein [Gammaproteobacteria bacterium]|nr:folate-binding protein [Gammaproteobacteria bacterium]
MTPVYCLLPERACIEVRGADAASFLHGQLSRTVDTLAREHAPLAAWLDARGRVRALFRVVRLDDRFLLLTERDAAATIVPKLRMFVLRAAVAIEPNDDWRLAALVDASGAAGTAPPVDTPRDTLVPRGGLRWVRVGPRLWHVLGTRAAIEDFEPSIARAPAPVAALAELELGIPAIGAAVADRYVPQMLNLDRLDALSFDKGCYPGQEVVARVQHLGSVKRRMRRYACDPATPPAPGAEVATAAGEPAGEIVRAAPAGGGFEALAVVDDAAAGGELFVAGARLREQPLP